MNSVMHTSAPSERQIRRNAASVTSSIGARTTGDAASKLRTVTSLFFELGDPATCCNQVIAHAQDDLDAGPIDLELAQQRAREQHAIDIDHDDVVVALHDLAFFDEPGDQLVVTIEELDEVLIRVAAHSAIPSRTGLEYAAALVLSVAASASSALSGIRTISDRIRSPCVSFRATTLPRNRNFAPFCVRAGTLTTTEPLNVGTSMLAPL